MAAALALPPANGLRRWTYHYLFGLIAVTGMRLSEAIGIQRSDVDLDGGVLAVRQSNFGKSRLIRGQTMPNGTATMSAQQAQLCANEEF
jgi:integrase